MKEGGGFSSANELVEFLLNEALSEQSSGCKMSKEEEEVKRRLRSLDYL